MQQVVQMGGLCEGCGRQVGFAKELVTLGKVAEDGRQVSYSTALLETEKKFVGRSGSVQGRFCAIADQRLQHVSDMTTSHALGLETGRGADREIASEYECELLARFRIAAPNRKEMQGDGMPCRVVHSDDGFDTGPKLRRRTTCIYGIEPGGDAV